MSEIDQTSPGTCEEELLSIKKKLRYQEGEWKKNKAVLEQRIEILELQNRELKEREENLKKMNNSIFSALKDFNKENDPTYSKIINELEASKQQIIREYADHRIRSQESMKNLEKENKELKERIAELEAKQNFTTLHYEKNDAALQQRIENLENEKKNVSLMLKLHEEERKQFKEKELNQNELQSKLSEVRYLLEKHTSDHRKELDRVRAEYNQALNDIKTLAEAEKIALENQIRKLMDNKKLDVTLFEDIKRNHENEIKVLRRERDNLWGKNESLEHQILNLNDNLVILEERLSQQKAEHEKEVKEFRKYKLKMMDTENQLRKFEQAEKNLKQMVTEKEYKLEEVTVELKKKIATEKRRYEQAQEIAKKYKEEGEKRCSIIMQESIKKDDIIRKLKGKAKADKTHGKGDNDTTKTNTSLVNMSLVNQSLSTSKYNPSRSFIQEVKTSRDANGSKSIIQVKKSQSKFSHDFTQKGPGKETQRENTDIEEDAEDLKDLTNENILLGLDSPRTSNTVRTSRNRSSNKKDTELSITSINRNNEKRSLNFKRADKSMTQDHLCQKCNQSMDISDKNSQQKPSYPPRKNTIDGSRIHVQQQNPSSTSFELKKKSTSFCETDSNFPHIKISSPEMGKMTPIDHDNSRSYFHINELGDNLNVTTSVNKANKSFQSIDPSSTNLSRRFQDMLDSNQKVTVSEFQQGGAEESIVTNRGKVGSEEKVKQLEDRLLRSEQKSEKAALELEKKQVELDRLILELKQTKMEWALSEESKEECELTLKNEIKFLITKLLQVKNGGSQEDNSQIMKSTNLNKSTIDPHSSYINTSGFLNSSQYNPVHHFGSFDQSSVLTNNLGEKHLSVFSDKKGPKKMQKVFSEESDAAPLRNKCMNSGDLDTLNDSPRRVSEFNSNENNLLLNLLNTSTNPKKLMRHVKR